MGPSRVVPIGTSKEEPVLATHPAPVAAEARAAAYRLRLRHASVYACRCCREAVRVASARHLPDTCPACAAGTWRADGHCAGIGCDVVRRPGLRGRGACRECGYSIWSPVAARGR